MARKPLDTALLEGRLLCPSCRGSLRAGDAALVCAGCARTYPVAEGGIPMFALDGDSLSKDAQRFWASLYQAAYGGRHANLDTATLPPMLDELETLFAHREHLAAVEMPRDLRGRDVLEIGSGAGGHSAVFARRGARMTALDLTPDRVLATARKFDLLDGIDAMAVQGDAARLPFPDGSFDIVYSNGVLHHTPRIREAVGEVHRVLKPGGRAVIMLYARNSFLYRGVLLPVRGVLQGGIFRDGRWLGHATEWMSEKPQDVKNPWTAVFSDTEARELFRAFASIQTRKNGFTFGQIPAIGRALSALAGKSTGWNESGVLVYDEPWRNETRLELAVGRFAGWGLNIVATK
jgi:ubiquinone/menaquinone biosynthesis C-methylase UbiE/uncharacterized protein YbaR (Trm112 family)